MALRRESSAPVAALSSEQRTRANELFAADPRPIILFDGVCNLCNGGVNFVLNWDRGAGKTRFAALQSDAGRALLQRCGRAPTDISSIVLVEKNTHYIKSDAVLRIADTLESPFPEIAALCRLFPGLIRDTVYDLVAANRYRIFGESTTCRLSDEKEAARFVSGMS